MGISLWPRKHLIVCILFVLPVLVMGDCTCDSGGDNIDKSKALKYKIGAIIFILIGSAIGVCFPILGKNIPYLRPETDVFFIVKAFAAGVILATGFIHVLPGAFDSLTSPCLSSDPWANFPFTGFIAMTSAIGTLLIDAFATSYYSSKSHSVKPHMTDDGDQAERGGRQEMQQAHTHSTQLPENSTSSQLLRHRVISQVLELGIIVHSVIIGIALGASQDPKTIRPLVAALTFHQCFEGIGLGGCITQAKFKARAVIVMAMFFSLTTPVGIAIGIGISNVYNENSPTALIVEGVLDSASAGILIYMALVDLLAADFMNARIQNNGGLQVRATVSLLIGSGCMSVLAKWA